MSKTPEIERPPLPLSRFDVAPEWSQAESDERRRRRALEQLARAQTLPKE